MRRLIFATLGLLLSGWQACGFAVDLSDRQAILVIEAAWNEPARFTTGQFDLLDGLDPGLKTDLAKRRIMPSDLHRFELMQKHGLVQVAVQRANATDSFRALDQAMEAGVVGRVTVTPTPTALALERATGKVHEDGALWLSDGRFSVTELVRNEAKTSGVEDYRLVMVAYDAIWEPAWKAFLEELTKSTLSEKRKAIALLRYDPLGSKWNVVARDYANADAPFSTSNVNSMLQ